MSKEYKGYTWWTKDWRSSDNIFELDLAQRGLFRELIDSAMSLDNKVPYKPKTWSRMFNCDLPTLLQMIEVLKEMELICIENDILFIPSCEKRLANKRNGAKGGSVKQTGKRNSKRIGKRTAKQTETETETYKQKQETKKENPSIEGKESSLKNQKSNKSQKKEIAPAAEIDWNNCTIQEAWSEWIEYKSKQHKFKYSSPKYEKIAKEGLFKLSGENENLAIQVIKYTIGNGWKGFVLPKESKPKNEKELNGFEQLMKYTS